MLFLTFNNIMNSFLHHQIITQDTENGFLIFYCMKKVWLFEHFPIAGHLVCFLSFCYYDKCFCKYSGSWILEDILEIKS